MSAPDSYLDAKRPALHDALALEGLSMQEGVESLKRKGYFTPPPRPWTVGVHDRGMGAQSFAVLDRFEDVVAEVQNFETAEFIMKAANAFKE